MDLLDLARPILTIDICGEWRDQMTPLLSLLGTLDIEDGPYDAHRLVQAGQYYNGSLRPLDSTLVSLLLDNEHDKLSSWGYAGEELQYKEMLDGQHVFSDESSVEAALAALIRLGEVAPISAEVVFDINW